MNYEEYLRSAEWQALRQKVLERDNCQCQTCLSTEDLECHHRTYERLGREDLSDLITLCHECHEAITSVIRRRRYAGRAIEVDSVIRLSSIIEREARYAEIEIQTTVRVPDHPPQRAISRSSQQVCEGIEEDQQQTRQDGRRFPGDDAD